MSKSTPADGFAENSAARENEARRLSYGFALLTDPYGDEKDDSIDFADDWDDWDDWDDDFYDDLDDLDDLDDSGD